MVIMSVVTSQLPSRDVTKTKQTASQMKLFSKNLPMMVGDRVCRGNAYWECYILLLRICDICISSALTQPIWSI